MTRRRSLVAAVLLVTVVVVVWLLGRERPPTPAATSGNDDARAATSTRPLRPSSPSSSAPAGGASAATPQASATLTPGSIPELTTPAPKEVPYPPETQKLTEEFKPGTTEWEDIPLDENGELLLRVLPLRYNVIVPQPIVVLLEVVDRRGRRHPIDRPSVRLRPFELPNVPWIDVPVVDDGTGGDAVAGDLQYTATYSPSVADRATLYGRVLVEGAAATPHGIRRVPTGLIYTAGPRARLTGKWRDWVSGGHLFLEAELDVEEAGLFTLMGQLFGPAKQPIAWVKEMRQLDKGRQTITLRVWGKAIADSAVDGPYHVRQVLLTRDMNDRGDYDPGPTIEEAWTTAPYRAREFSTATWTPPSRTVEEVGPDHPSQQNKPAPERTRVYDTPAPASESAPARQAPVAPR